MGSVELKWNSKKVERFFKDINKNFNYVKHRNKAYAGAISAFVFQDVMDHFANEEGPNGKWKFWSDAYVLKLLFRKNPPENILQDTGRLRNNFKPTKWRKTSEGFLWFNNAQTKSGFPYAYAHDEGGPRLPQRSFMWLSDKAMKKISEASLKFLLGGR